MRTIVIAAFCTVILSGCIPQTMHFTRPGLTYEEWNRDFGECAYIEHSRACGGYGSSSSVYGSTISTTYNLDCSQDLPIESFDTAIRAGVIVTGQSLDQKTDRRDQLIGLCLRAKGYVEQRAE